MANKKNQNKNKILLLIVVALLLGTFFLPIPIVSKIIVAAIIVLFYLYSRIPYIYFVKGAKTLQKDEEKAWPYFKKAIDKNLPAEQAVLVGSAFIQQGDVDYGVKLLEKIQQEQKGTDTANLAAVTASMGYWRQGNLDKAIDILEELRKSGYEDDNLLINLCTYLLEKGDTSKAKSVINHSEKKFTTLSSGMVDNKLWYLIQTENWEEAVNLSDELVNERKPKFPEAYVHAAQVYIHFDYDEEAIKALSDSLSKRYTKTCSVNKDLTQALIDGLSNPETRDKYAAVMDNNVKAIALNKGFTPEKLLEQVQTVKIEKKVNLKKLSEKKENTKNTKKTKEKVLNDKDFDSEKIIITKDDIEEDVNTDLDEDEDLSYFLDNQKEAMAIDEDDTDYNVDEYGEDIVTDITDDEREPNIDLTEEDFED